MSLRNNDTLAADSIQEFQHAVQTTEAQISKDEDRLQSLLAETKAATDNIASIRALCQESNLRVDALEAEVVKMSNVIALRREEIDQTTSAVTAARAPRLQVEEEAATVAVSARQCRATVVAHGSTLQADIVKMISTSNPSALQKQIEAQNVQLHALRAHVELCRASVAKLRAMQTPAPAAFACSAEAPSALDDPIEKAEDSLLVVERLRQELQRAHDSFADAKTRHSDAASAFQKQRDELRVATKRMCFEAEASEAAYHAARKDYDALSDAAAATFCTLCRRSISSE